MTDPARLRKRIPLWILGFLVVATVLISLIDNFVQKEKHEVLVSPAKGGILPHENTFESNPDGVVLSKQTQFVGMSEREYYLRRQYQGSPPTIPHPVEDQFGFAQSCLSCHGGGGYVAKYGRFAPLVPHPERVNCTQCHVQKKTTQLFRQTLWSKYQRVGLNDRAHITGPPRIPHGFHERTNCLSCHGGAGNLKRIRTSHPERINCRQCHLPVTVNHVFTRPGGGQ